VDGDCFIYGSVHVKMPRRDVVERVLGIVDYVLLEGLSVKNWRELVRRDWGTMIVVVGLLAYFKILRLLTKAASLYYRSRYGIEFRGDMMYVAELARRMGKRVERVDEDLLSIYERNREVFRPRLTSILLVLLLCFVVYDLWATAVGFLTGHYAQATKWFISTLLTIAVTPILLTAPFINAATTIRDAKLINRVQELIDQGHKVLIVRGERHVEYIVGELRKRGIECEELNKASPHRPSTTTERFEAFAQHIAQPHPDPGSMSILRSLDLPWYYIVKIVVGVSDPWLPFRGSRTTSTAPLLIPLLSRWV